MKGDRLYVEHILECIERIERYSRDGGDSFLNSDLIQDAIVRNLQLLAEPVKRLSPNLKAAYQGIDWHGVVGFRNVLVHEYLGINFQRVYDVVALDLPSLKSQMELIRDGLLPSAGPPSLDP